MTEWILFVIKALMYIAAILLAWDWGERSMERKKDGVLIDLLNHLLKMFDLFETAIIEGNMTEARNEVHMMRALILKQLEKLEGSKNE